MTDDLVRWERLLDEAIREVAGYAIPPDARFFDAGLTSAAVVEMHELLRVRAGVAVDVSVFFKYPSRRLLAAHLSQTRCAVGAPTMRPLPQEWTATARRDLRGRLWPGRTA